MYEIHTRTVPAQLVVTEQRTVDQSQLLEWLPGAMARVTKAAEGFGGPVGTLASPYLLRQDQPDQPVIIVVFGGNPNESPVTVDVCAPVDPGGPRPAGGATRRLPAHREAYTRVTKQTVESGRIGEAYVAVERWTEAQGLAITDAPRETYWTDFGAAAPTDPVLDVCFPVE